MILHPVVSVSLGPGDPELVTLKALKQLQVSDEIYAPATISEKGETSRAVEILISLGIPQERIITIDLPMSRFREGTILVYKQWAESIIASYRKGKKVSFVSIGDACFYSSIQYISELLTAQNIEVKHIAGVPAFIACGAAAGVHIVKQNEQLLVIASELKKEELLAALQEGKTVVLMKLSKQEDLLKEVLNRISGQVDFYYFENVGLSGKEYKTSDLKALSNRSFPYFSTMIIRSKDE